MSPPPRPWGRLRTPHLEPGPPLEPAVLPCPRTFLTGSWQEALRSDVSVFQGQKRKAESPAWGTVKGVQGPREIALLSTPSCRWRLGAPPTQPAGEPAGQSVWGPSRGGPVPECSPPSHSPSPPPAEMPADGSSRHLCRKIVPQGRDSTPLLHLCLSCFHNAPCHSQALPSTDGHCAISR